MTPSALLILAISELTTSGYPAYMCPCPTLQVRGCAHRPHMARGQDGFASPFLYDSFIHYFTPVYPDAIQGGALCHAEAHGEHFPAGHFQLAFAGVCAIGLGDSHRPGGDDLGSIGHEPFRSHAASSPILRAGGHRPGGDQTGESGMTVFAMTSCCARFSGRWGYFS